MRGWVNSTDKQISITRKVLSSLTVFWNWDSFSNILRMTSEELWLLMIRNALHWEMTQQQTDCKLELIKGILSRWVISLILNPSTPVNQDAYPPPQGGILQSLSDGDHGRLLLHEIFHFGIIFGREIWQFLTLRCLDLSILCFHSVFKQCALIGAVPWACFSVNRVPCYETLWG